MVWLGFFLILAFSLQDSDSPSFFWKQESGKNVFFFKMKTLIFLHYAYSRRWSFIRETIIVTVASTAVIPYCTD